MIHDNLKKIFAEVFQLDPSQIHTSLSPESLPEWDSLGHQHLVFEIEKVFSISLSPEEVSEMTDFNKITELLEARGIAA